MVPFPDKETDFPKWSLAASPSISLPSWVHVPIMFLYTLTWPDSVPLVPSLWLAPIATMVPFPDKETEFPDRLPAASPFISPPSWVHVPLTFWYTLTWPEERPLPSLYSAPIATMDPSLDKETEVPDWSLAASPSISLPSCVHVPLTFWYTLTCPASLPVPSLWTAPIATMDPSLDKETEVPDWSLAASPSISLPSCVHVPLTFWYTLTCPALLPLPSLWTAPIATMDPLLDKETEYPDRSSAASPSISLPIFVQLVFFVKLPLRFWYTLTCPALLPLPSLWTAPIATMDPSLDKETEYPDRSPAASPSISSPISVLLPLTFWWYTLTCPAFVWVPSLLTAPIATMVPLLDKETENPDRSPAASPSISLPIFVEKGAAAAALPSIAVKAVPLKTFNSPFAPQSEHHNINPAGGLLMLLRCAAVILGGKKPWVVEETSNAAAASGVLVPTPTCALTDKEPTTEQRIRTKLKTERIARQRIIFFITIGEH